MFHSVLNMSVSITAQLFVQWPYAMYCIRHIQNSVIFSALFFQVYADIFNHVECYSDLLTNIETLLRHMQAYQLYSAPCVTLVYSQPCHILIPSIFRTLWNVDQVYSELCHRALFSHIQAFSESCVKLVYAETWHTQNPWIFRTLA